MFTMQKKPSGLGWFLNGTGDNFSFSHGGDTYGYKCEMIMYPNRKEGIVIMTNGEKGQLLIEEILRGNSMINGWDDYKIKKKNLAPLSLIQQKDYTGTYTLDEYPNIKVVISELENGLVMKVVQPGITPLEAKLYYEGNEKFFRLDVDMEIKFSEQQYKITLNQSGQIFQATKSNNG